MAANNFSEYSAYWLKQREPLHPLATQELNAIKTFVRPPFSSVSFIPYFNGKEKHNSRIMNVVKLNLKQSVEFRLANHNSSLSQSKLEPPPNEGDVQGPWIYDWLRFQCLWLTIKATSFVVVVFYCCVRFIILWMDRAGFKADIDQSPFSVLRWTEAKKESLWKNERGTNFYSKFIH